MFTSSSRAQGRRWVEAGGELQAHCDGASLHIGGCELLVRAPLLGALEDHWANSSAPLAAHANRISVVAELVHGASSIVLGGDLPDRESSALLPHGWSSVMNTHPHLSQHVSLKIPHHGSIGAIHAGLMNQPRSGDRAWLLTPYNSSKIPRTEDGDGLDQLLGWQTPIHLTAPSVSRACVRNLPSSTIDRATLERYQQAVSRPTFDPYDTFVALGSAAEPLDAIWCLAIDAHANVTGRWYGRAAIQLQRSAA